jgi:DNA-binding transcriptional LysR family regulator
MFDETRLRVFAAIAREGSLTAAAAALQYAQPSVSHHLARLEAEVGVPLVQRAGRGIRLTEAGRLLADRAGEILGRIDAARTELAAHAGLRAGRVRLAAFPSALATLVPAALAAFITEHPAVELALTEAEPPEALAALRRGEVDLALAFHHEPAPPREPSLHRTPLLREQIYLIGTGPSNLAGCRDERWIAGCPRCRVHLVATCEESGFTPEIAFETDDYVAVQALVAGGIGVSTLPGLALRAHRDPAVTVTPIPGRHRYVEAVTYGAPPVPVPTRAFLTALTRAALDHGAP